MPWVPVKLEMVTLIHWKKGFIFHSLSLSWRAAVLGVVGFVSDFGRFFSIISLFLTPEFVLLDSKSAGFSGIRTIYNIPLVSYRALHKSMCANK